MWNEAILEKFPEEENEEPFHASPAETENTGKTEVHGGTVETSHGCSAQSDWARKNTHHTDAGIGSPVRKEYIPARPSTRKSEYYHEFRSNFQQLLSPKCRPIDIWRDFIVMVACAMSNTVDKAHYDEREKRYLEIINKYEESQQHIFPKLYAAVVLALDENPEQDFLGEMFMDLHLDYEELKQIFTPYHVCQLMADITMDDLVEQIDKQGYVSINDCCCGAGANLIAAINSARRKLEDAGLNFQNHILIIGQDIEELVALMCYIQISLLGVAGYIKVGNALTKPMTPGDSMENYWFTPMYFSDVWHTRRTIRTVIDLFKEDAT